ncbi:MAG: hypothetical protein NDJ89_11830 [Oligoflexia bacterium]|nr:hypothetical protein [Oligoflexia bacterium]
MRIASISVGILFFAGTAAACPDLSGKWNCRNSDESLSALEVVQESIPNGILYRVTDQTGATVEYPADGVLHAYVKGDYSSTILVTCFEDRTIESVQEFKNDKIGLFGTIEQRIHLRAFGQLASATHSRIALGGKVKEKSIESICEME